MGNRSSGTMGRRLAIRIAAATAVAVAFAHQEIGQAGAQSIAPPAAKTQNHDGADAPQVFAESVWSVSNALSLSGATAQLTSGPFVNTSRSSLRSDCRLSLRIVSSSGTAGWTAIVPMDETSFEGGDTSATVVARSTGLGGGELGLTVTFVNSDYSILGAGEYQATVTGTIAAN